MTKLDTYLSRMSKTVPTLQVRMEDFKREDTYAYSSTKDTQTFHSASVGKVFAAVCVMKAKEEGKVALDTPIHTLLKDQWLGNLFVFKGHDYKDEVTLEHLLTHTSGVNDYFEGKTAQGKTFLQGVFDNKDHLYTPEELLDFTRTHQEAVGKPGERFLYSDTGYVLVGLCLEALYEKPYADILKDVILSPLKLEDTALCFYDERFNQEALAPLYFRGVEMSQAKSLSCDH
ncbi:MAG: serine hydrolase domain-containing protein, partial [Bacillota bacterium]